jgi:hypothetical protein
MAGREIAISGVVRGKNAEDGLEPRQPLTAARRTSRHCGIRAAWRQRDLFKCPPDEIIPPAIKVHRKS